MTHKVNYWWCLPVITGLAGVALAWQLFPEPNKALEATVAIVKINPQSPQVESLMVTQVAMPPMPPRLPSAYQAKINKQTEQVVVKQQTNKVIEPQQSLAVVEQSGVSNDLTARFNQALADMAAEKNNPKPAVTQHAKALTRYPQWYQDLVPSLDFSSHIYSSDKDDRWVKVNQQVVKEGELITADLRLVLITPEQVVIEMQQRHFTLPALSTW